MATMVRDVIETKDQLLLLPQGTLLVDTESGESYRMGSLNFLPVVVTQGTRGQENAKPLPRESVRDTFIPLTVVWRPDEA